MTNWSYGIGETINLVIPNAKGGGSGAYLLEENLMENSEVSNGFKNFIKNAYQKGWTINTYWGEISLLLLDQYTLEHQFSYYLYLVYFF